jgi:hypothetical protein
MRGIPRIVEVLVFLAGLLPQRLTLATETDTGHAEAQLGPLHLAAERGDTAAARRLLDGGSPVDPTDGLARTPLHLAALGGHVEVARLLLDRGADPNARAAFQMTPLHYAAMLGRPEMAGLLARRGARTDARNERGATPLHLAADEKVVAVLAAAGAPLEATDADGKTPLHSARQSFIARALLDRKADLRVRDKRGLTSMEIAAVEMLETEGLSFHSVVLGRLRGLIGAMPLTMTNISAHPLHNIEVAGHSPACEVEAEPVRVEKLVPGQATDVRLSFVRLPNVAEGEYPLYVSVTSAGRKLGEIDLRVDTRAGETPTDRGMIRLAKGRLRPSSSRWYYLVFAAVPLLVVGAWLFFRRR